MKRPLNEPPAGWGGRLRQQWKTIEKQKINKTKKTNPGKLFGEGGGVEGSPKEFPRIGFLVLLFFFVFLWFGHSALAKKKNMRKKRKREKKTNNKKKKNEEE